MSSTKSSTTPLTVSMFKPIIKKLIRDRHDLLVYDIRFYDWFPFSDLEVIDNAVILLSEFPLSHQNRSPVAALQHMMKGLGRLDGDLEIYSGCFTTGALNPVVEIFEVCEGVYSPLVPIPPEYLRVI